MMEAGEPGSMRLSDGWLARALGAEDDRDDLATLAITNQLVRIMGGAIGVELNPTIRLEGEIGLHVNTADQGGTGIDWTFRTVSFMGNGYIDFPMPSPFRPYLGAGLGFAIVDLEADDFGLTANDSDLVAAFQLMAGIGYEISPKATLTFGYRYFTTSDPSFVLPISGSFETEFTSHDFLFGARFRF
ncbi:MAG: porin family protein [Nitrospinae bacterium]|nr:porin family protein [Nitrospinota bacterium]